jgi:hypothetical protein
VCRNQAKSGSILKENQIGLFGDATKIGELFFARAYKIGLG